MNKITVVISSVLFGTFTLTGCAPRTNARVEQVESELAFLKSSPGVATKAPAQLHDAEQAVQRAENDWSSTHDSQEAEHLTYLAGKRIEIARVKANQGLAEGEAVRLSHARDIAAADSRASMATATAVQSDLIIQERQAEIDLLKTELGELKATESTRGLSLTLSDVLFESNRAELRPGAARKLIPLAKYIQNHPRDIVTIEGHTDNMGTVSFNLDLSARRAEAVRDSLIQDGLDSSRIVTHGMGEQYPLVSNNTEAGRLQNRRVEVIISSSNSDQLIR